jgi:hypothetical protein
MRAAARARETRGALGDGWLPPNEIAAFYVLLTLDAERLEIFDVSVQIVLSHKPPIPLFLCPEAAPRFAVWLGASALGLL